MLSTVPTPTYGSSPRARGTRRLALLRRILNRFIPAGAGNTSMRLRSSLTCSVHPRGRGEHEHLLTGGIDAAGSSPRARGTRVNFRQKSPQPRFIPAGAGNTR